MSCRIGSDLFKEHAFCPYRSANAAIKYISLEGTNSALSNLKKTFHVRELVCSHQNGNSIALCQGRYPRATAGNIWMRKRDWPSTSIFSNMNCMHNKPISLCQENVSMILIVSCEILIQMR